MFLSTRFLSVAAATLIGGMVASGPAQAATTTWDLTSTGINGGISGNPVTELVADDGNLLDVQGYVVFDLLSSGFLSPSRLDIDQNKKGIGVDWSDFFLTNDSGQLDNNFGTDFLVFEFSTDTWSPVSLGLTKWDSNDDIELFGWNGSSDPATGIPAGILQDSIDYEVTDNGDSTATVSFLTASTFQYLGISGISGFIFDEDGEPAFGDDFRVASIQGNLAPVPVPAALPLLATAFAGFGFFSWRRKRKAAA